jgi:hypothetical protein
MRYVFVAAAQCMSIVLLFSVAVSSCDMPPTVAPAAEVTSCVLTDDKLSVVFKQPVKARTYLRELRRRLRNKDSEAVREAADLIARFMECLPE